MGSQRYNPPATAIEITFIAHVALFVGSRSSMKLQSLGYNLNINWSPDGNYIVAGNSSNNVIVWDIRTGNQVRKRKFNYEVMAMNLITINYT